MTNAPLILDEKHILADGGIVQMRIREVPVPVVGSAHNYKYSLVYIQNGQRVVGYDNERTKGDHRHYGNTEEAYQFTTAAQLIQDFLGDVARLRTEG